MAMKPLLYTNDHAGKISYLVYMNGLEVPSAGYDVSYGVWEIPQASVRLVPDPILHRLGAEDRISVQCFYLDQWQHSPPQYCLDFDGEIVSWGMQHTAAGRFLTFTCVDYTAILTQTFFFLMSTFDDFAVGTSGANIGVEGSTVQTPGFGALYPYSLFAQGVANASDITDDRIIERPIDYAYNIVRALIKLQQPNRGVPAANFFTPWTKRTNYHRRWVATPYFDADPQDPHAPGLFPILKAVQDTQAIAAIARQASAAANGSLWSMLQEILRTVMCELVMLPTPAAVRSDYRSLLPQGKPEEPSAGASPVFLTQYFVKPQSYYALPPVCNVFFPSQIQQYAYQENYATQPTRAYYNEVTITNILSTVAGNEGVGQEAGGRLMQDAMTTGYPEEVNIAARDARDSALQNGRNMLVYPEEYFKGPVILRKQLPRFFAYLLDASRGTISQSGGSADTETGGIAGNNASQYSQSEAYVYFGSISRPERRLLDVLGIRTFVLSGNAANPEQRSLIMERSLAISTPGESVPPQCFPLRPATSWTNFGGPTVGGFWNIRGNNGNTSLHAGHDIAAPKGTEVVSTVVGIVHEIVAATPRTRKGSPVPVNAQRQSAETGNMIVIRDEKGGLHRYMHLHEVMVLAVGDRVAVGQKLGTVGRTGIPTGYHLHYDVVCSKHLYRFYYGRRLASQARNPRITSSDLSETPVPEGGTTPQSDRQNAELHPETLRNTSGDGGTGDTDTDVAAGDTTRNLFELYAKCDYFTERYAQRQGTLSMPFNPYPIPGFSCAVFDRRDTACDTVGYIMNVQHSVSAAGWGTTVTYSQGRTFQEMFSLMQRDAALDAARMGRDSADILSAVDSRYAAGETRIQELRSAVGEADSADSATQLRKWATGVPSDYDWVTPALLESPGTPITHRAAEDASSPASTSETNEESPPPSLATNTAADESLSRFAAPGGDIRMAPAEPIEEVRILQDVERADAFYKAMFWQAEDQPSADDLTGEDVSTVDREREGRGSAAFLTPQEIAAAGDNPPRAVAAQAVDAATEASRNRTRAERRNRTRAARASLEGSSVFRQETIVRMVTDEDERLDIEASGTSAMSRTRALQLIRRCAYRPDLMTPDDIEALCDAAAGISGASGMTAAELTRCLPRRTYQNGSQPPSGTWGYVPCPNDQYKLLGFLREQERRWRTQSATTNVRGDVTLEPTPAAAGLFESYTAAMRYNARPVCTLDEYLLFLGNEDAKPKPVGGLRTGFSDLGRNDYRPDARYYAEIREYVQGPPSVRARTMLVGRATGEDEREVAVPGDPVQPSSTEPAAQPTLAPGDTVSRALSPAEAQRKVGQLHEAWNGVYAAVLGTRAATAPSARLRVDEILAAYLRVNDKALTKITPPVTRSEATHVATVVREYLLRTNEHGTPLVRDSIGGPFLWAFAQPQSFADRPSDADGGAARAEARVNAYEAQRTAQLEAIEQERVADLSRSVVGTHTIEAQYVAGVPASFPETRANWYGILLRYRENVLRRDDPRG